MLEQGELDVLDSLPLSMARASRRLRAACRAASEAAAASPSRPGTRSWPCSYLLCIIWKVLACVTPCSPQPELTIPLKFLTLQCLRAPAHCQNNSKFHQQRHGLDKQIMQGHEAGHRQPAARALHPPSSEMRAAWQRFESRAARHQLHFAGHELNCWDA